MTTTFEIRDGQLLVGGLPVLWPAQLYVENYDFEGDQAAYSLKNRGFQYHFENGWRLSCQWGRYNYGTNYIVLAPDLDAVEFTEVVDEVEVAILPPLDALDQHWLGADIDDEEFETYVFSWVPVYHVVRTVIPSLMSFPTNPTPRERRAMQVLVETCYGSPVD